MRSRKKSAPRLSEVMELALRGLDLSLYPEPTTATLSPVRLSLLPKAWSGGNASAGRSSLRLLGQSARDAESE